jgi:hypothetical protein
MTAPPSLSSSSLSRQPRHRLVTLTDRRSWTSKVRDTSVEIAATDNGRASLGPA